MTKSKPICRQDLDLDLLVELSMLLHFLGFWVAVVVTSLVEEGCFGGFLGGGSCAVFGVVAVVAAVVGGDFAFVILLAFSMLTSSVTQGKVMRVKVCCCLTFQMRFFRKAFAGGWQNCCVFVAIAANRGGMVIGLHKHRVQVDISEWKLGSECKKSPKQGNVKHELTSTWGHLRWQVHEDSQKSLHFRTNLKN